MKKGMLRILIANLITLAIGLITNFMLPKFLSVESYAVLKTYTLYISYAGFFSLGYNDGMYLKYGGKDISEINKDGLNKNIVNYLIIEALMTIILFVTSIFLKNDVLLAFSLGMFSTNAIGYLKSLYQATGEYREYGNALNFVSILVFLISCVLIFVIHSDNPMLYIYIQVIVPFIVMIWLIIQLEKKIHFFRKLEISIDEIKINISNGIVLMLGNFSSTLFTSIDRWFIKILFSTIDFATYSFAVSLESIINVFISPICISMYNYFCKSIDKHRIEKAKNYTLVWGGMVIGAAFPAKWILEHFLNKYYSSSPLIFLLFGAQSFLIIVKGIYVNIYKAEKKQKKYLGQITAMTIIGTVLNGIFYFAFRSTYAIAAATMLTSFLWYAFCEIDDSNNRSSCKIQVLLILNILIYLASGLLLPTIVGMIVYYTSWLALVYVFMNSTFKELITMGKTVFVKYIGNKNA